MDGERLGADSPRSVRLAQRMRSKPYRDGYVASHTRQFLARQMREFRGEQSQTDFGDRIGKQQTVVSRLEDPNYGKWTLQTLFDVARSLDIAVLVRFVDFPTFLRSTRDTSEAAARPASYDQRAVDEVARKDQLESALSALFGARPETQPEEEREHASEPAKANSGSNALYDPPAAPHDPPPPPPSAKDSGILQNGQLLANDNQTRRRAAG